MKRFGDVALSGDDGRELLSPSALSRWNALPFVISYIATSVGVRLERSAELLMLERPLSFEFIIADIADLTARVLHMGFIDYARAKVQSQEVARTVALLRCV